MIHEVHIATADVANKNNRIYTTEALTKAIDDFNKRQMRFSWFGMENDGHLESVSHKIESLELRDGEVYGKVQVLKTPNGQILDLMMSKLDMMPDFRISAHAKVDADGKVSDLTINAVNAVSRGTGA